MPRAAVQPVFKASPQMSKTASIGSQPAAAQTSATPVQASPKPAQSSPKAAPKASIPSRGPFTVSSHKAATSDVAGSPGRAGLHKTLSSPTSPVAQPSPKTALHMTHSSPTSTRPVSQLRADFAASSGTRPKSAAAIPASVAAAASSPIAGRVGGRASLSDTASRASPVHEEHRHELQHQKEVWFKNPVPEPITLALFDAHSHQSGPGHEVSPKPSAGQPLPQSIHATKTLASPPSSPPASISSQVSSEFSPPVSPSTKEPLSRSLSPSSPTQKQHPSVTTSEQTTSKTYVVRTGGSVRHPSIAKAMIDMHSLGALHEVIMPEHTTEVHASSRHHTMHVKSTRHEKSELKHEKSMKKSASSTGFLRYSKMSLRYLLDQRSKWPMHCVPNRMACDVVSQ